MADKDIKKTFLIGVLVTQKEALEIDVHRAKNGFRNRSTFIRYALLKAMGKHISKKYIPNKYSKREPIPQKEEPPVEKEIIIGAGDNPAL